EVYRLAGDEPNAITYYQKYLDVDPNGRGAAAARTAVDELRRSIATKQGVAKRAADDEVQRKQPAISPGMSPAVPAAHVWYRDPIRLALLGTGVAATGVGTGFLFAARSADHEAKTATTYQQAQDAGNRASQRGTVGSITSGVGIALVGGGVAWIF